MDAIEVYLATLIVGGRNQGSEVVTDVQLGPPDREGSTATLSFVSMRSDGEPGHRAYPSQQVVETDEYTDVYDLTATRGNRVAVKRRYVVLTHENFASIKDKVEGYERVVSSAPTDPQLRAWYREALSD